MSFHVFDLRGTVLPFVSHVFLVPFILKGTMGDTVPVPFPDICRVGRIFDHVGGHGGEGHTGDIHPCRDFLLQVDVLGDKLLDFIEVAAVEFCGDVDGVGQGDSGLFNFPQAAEVLGIVVGGLCRGRPFDFDFAFSVRDEG